LQFIVHGQQPGQAQQLLPQQSPPPLATLPLSSSSQPAEVNWSFSYRGSASRLNRRPSLDSAYHQAAALAQQQGLPWPVSPAGAGAAAAAATQQQQQPYHLFSPYSPASMSTSPSPFFPASTPASRTPSFGQQQGALLPQGTANEGDAMPSTNGDIILDQLHRLHRGDQNDNK